MIIGKLYNSRRSIERTIRDHSFRVDTDRLSKVSEQLKTLIGEVSECCDADTLRGYEGVGASIYFGVFVELILNQKDTFKFTGRNRRPPLDPVNAMLSFSYSMLANDCASALESAGLDSYVGFMHRDRPGRTSLALDIMEELRPCMSDRFVIH